MFSSFAVRKIIKLVKCRYECISIIGDVATLFNGEHYIAVNSKGEQSIELDDLVSKQLDQFVILEKNGTFNFSPNLPLIEGREVVGVFNCLDEILERHTFTRYLPKIEISDFTMGKEYIPVCEKGVVSENDDTILLVDDTGCKVIVPKSAFIIINGNELLKIAKDGYK